MTRIDRLLLLTLSLALLAPGCAATKQARGVDRSGFLGDTYDLLRDGEDGEALRIYLAREHRPVQPGTYGAIWIDRVAVWAGRGDDLDEAEQADVQRLTDHFHALLREEVGSLIPLADAAGPGVLRLEAAITDASPARPALRFVSSVPAPMNFANMTSTVKGLLTGKRLFVGDVTAEIRVTDSATGELLGAAVDRRVGGRRVDLGVFSTWADVDDSIRYWARLVRYRICQNRDGAGCVEPE